MCSQERQETLHPLHPLFSHLIHFLTEALLAHHDLPASAKLRSKRRSRRRKDGHHGPRSSNGAASAHGMASTRFVLCLHCEIRSAPLGSDSAVCFVSCTLSETQPGSCWRSLNPPDGSARVWTVSKGYLLFQPAALPTTCPAQVHLI